jgi:hypothetical protein
MDPQIRKVNEDHQIQSLSFGNGIHICKVCGYADYIVFIIQENTESLINLFRTYHNFSKISGIEPNTSKTEILRLGVENEEKEYKIIGIEGEEVAIKSIHAMKVCEITFLYYEEAAY